MAEQLILLAPGEERLIRIRCAAPEENRGNLPEEVVPAPADDMSDIPRVNLPRSPPVQENIAPPTIEEMAQRKGSRKGTRKNRKANGATRKNRKQSGGNSYMNFAKDERKKVLNDHPELKSDVVAVARKIGEAWRKLSESERKKY